MTGLEELNQEIVSCRLCPRLVAWREQIASERKRSFADQIYWGKPVPYFGDFEAGRLILGLAPAAHGANRTGRMFTGDRSGDFLFAALCRAGVANQPTSVSNDDGLQLKGVLIAATAHCAPPANKLNPDEIANCSRYLLALLELRKFRSILCLGAVAWDHLHRLCGVRSPSFSHRAGSELPTGENVVASYHPSQQNTFTGKLTPEMFDAAIKQWLSA
jgi:uracil-DNA glycosylase family 4